MTDGLEAVTTATLALALDAASLRQQAIAANIANANTPGYAPLRVNFEGQLDDARRALELGGRVDLAALEGIEPAIETTTVDALGLPSAVQLDVEVAGMAQNAVHYQALLKGLSTHYALLAAAVGDGRK